MKTVDTKMLACRRLTGTIDNEMIAKELIDILQKYDILEKVVAVTTDNGADFCAALRKHGDNYSSYEAYLDQNNDDDEIEPMDIENDTVLEMVPRDEYVDQSDEHFDFFAQRFVNDDDDNDDENIALHDLNEFEQILAKEIESADCETNTKFLSIRISCAAHTLNLIGKVDSFHALAVDDYASEYFSVMKTLNTIWQKTDGKSRKNQEMVERYLKRRIYKPHRIRWNRIYDAVSSVFKI